MFRRNLWAYQIYILSVIGLDKKDQIFGVVFPPLTKGVIKCRPVPTSKRPSPSIRGILLLGYKYRILKVGLER